MKMGKDSNSLDLFGIGLFIFGGVALAQLLLACRVWVTLKQQPGAIADQTPDVSDFVVVLASAVVCCLYEALNHKVVYGVFHSVAKGNTDELKHFFADKACLNFYKCTYFTFATVWGYLVLAPTGWLPWHLGGVLSLYESFNLVSENTPFVPVSRPIQLYGLITMGFHLGDWFAMALFRVRTSDHGEMTLHHIATFSCYFAIISNNMRIGYVAFFLHDIADIFTTMGRTVSSTRLEFLTVPVIVCLLSTWVWTRLFVLPQLLYRIITTPTTEIMYYPMTLNAA